MSIECQPPIPILRSFDEMLAKDFYVGFLGFQLTFEHRFEPGAPLYMGLCLGQCLLHLSEHFGDASPGTSLRIEVPDVRGFAFALNAKRYGNARPDVQRQGWGCDDMAISDPFGNRLIFCTPVQKRAQASAAGPVQAPD